MAKRFRRLRRAARQVIEVTRRFWRFCHCCGTMRAGFTRDVIPVSVALSCTNLPPVRTPIFCCHLPMKEATLEPSDTTERRESSTIGPQNWIRPTESGPQSNHEMPECSRRRQDVPFLYIPGSFSSDYQVTPSGISFFRSDDQPQRIQQNYRNLVSQPWRSPYNSLSTVPVPIWSVNRISQPADRAPLRSFHEPQLIRNHVYRVENGPRRQYNSSSGSFLSPSGIMNSLSYDVRHQPRINSHTTPRATYLSTTSVNNMVHLMTPVEVPCTATSRECGYSPRPSDSSFIVIPSSASRNNTARLLSTPTIKVTPSSPSSWNRICSSESISDQICSDVIESLRVGQAASSESPSFIVIDEQFETITPSSEEISPNHGTLAVSETRACRTFEHSASTISLPGCSLADPELRLNLNLLNGSSTGVVISPDIRVKFTLKDEWNDLDPINWHHRQTLTRTRYGSVTVAFCETFRKNYVLKTLPAEHYNTEVEILRNCQCPFVVEMQAVLTQGEDNLLCMSYYGRLDLDHWLRKDQDRIYFAEKDATFVCSYILTGLEFIHNKGYLHLDIKPSNILISTNGYPVLGDFGSARSTDDNSGHFRRYTPSYASPEVLRGDTPTNQADLWSTACVFYEVVAGRSPYQGQTRAETELKILESATPDVSMMSLDAQHFIYSQLKDDSNNRLGFSFGAREVMRHRIFHSMNWDKIKYGHRHSDCRLLRVLQALDQADAEPSQSSSSSAYNINNSRRWELSWSSSSSQGSDEDFGFSKRVIYTLKEEDEENDESEVPPDHDNVETVDRYGVPEGPFGTDEVDDGVG